MSRIAIIHPEGNLTNNPNLSGIVSMLCERGFDVDIYSPRFGEIEQSAPCRGSRFRLTPPEHLIRHVTAVLPTAILGSQQKIAAYITSSIERCDVVIGIDRGILEASLIAQHFRVPYGLISYEILFASEAGADALAPDIAASKDVSFAVCQDRVRSYHLSRENRIPLERIIDIPVAGRRVRPCGRSSVLHDCLGIPKSRKIALYIGSIASQWSGIDELLACADTWPDEWVLVLHERYGQYDAGLKQMVAARRRKNIFLSPFEVLPFERLHELLAGVDIGLSFYTPVAGDPNAGNNLAYIGMASGKTATYLQHGIPVIINGSGEMCDHVRRAGLGKVVAQISELPVTLATITEPELDAWRANSVTFFNATLDLDVRITPLLNAIERCLRPSAAPVRTAAAGERTMPTLRIAGGKKFHSSSHCASSQPSADAGRGACRADAFRDYQYAKRRHFTDFGANDRALFGTTIDPDYADLKAYQDLLVFTFIRNNIPPGSRILDIGGGDSRILKHFRNTYECWNLDKLEGVGNGPRSVEHAGYRLVSDYIGNFNAELPEHYFDFIFSISALEHVPNGRAQHEQFYEKICLDMDRILKPGGCSLHLFDILLSDVAPCWTNDLAPYMSEYFKDANPYIPIETIRNDPELFVVSERYFNDFWKGAPYVGEYEEGKPSSWNIFWRKPEREAPLRNAAPKRNASEAAAPAQPSVSARRDAMPKITIVTPSYNQGAYLEACIESVLSQHYPNLEYIIMDGGSTDGSVEIIKKYADRLAYWQSEPDGGQYRAINAGFELSSGEIMGWLNSDDKLHAGSLELVARIFTSYGNVEWITGRHTGWDEAGNLHSVIGEMPDFSRGTYFDWTMKRNTFIQQESTFWKRSLWTKAGGALDCSLSLAADFELWMRFFRHAQLHSVDALLGGFRTHEGQKTGSMMNAYMSEVAACVRKEIDSLRARSGQIPFAPPASRITQEDLARMSRPSVTAENFSYFTYARRDHFGFFGDNDLALYGAKQQWERCDLSVYQELLAYTFITNTLSEGASVLVIGNADSPMSAALGRGYRVHTVGASAEALHSMPESGFDCVVSTSALSHMPQDEASTDRIAAELSRVMKPGAWALHCFNAYIGVRSARTSPLVTKLFAAMPVLHPFVPLTDLCFDPHLFALSEEMYEACGWHQATGQTYQAFGRPTSYNILWKK